MTKQEVLVDKMTSSIPFQSNNLGKCNNCQEHKHLDSMVRQEYQKGTYECLDCFTDKIEIKEYGQYMTWKIDHTKVNKTKLKKLVGWLTGR